jgi:hypothetical protein
MHTAPDPLAAFNERLKAAANFLNAIGIGLIGFAVLRPLTEAFTSTPLSALWWGLAGLALHGGAHYVLGHIRREVNP